jgi:putative ABC transport system substrate-binding protein
MTGRREFIVGLGSAAAWPMPVLAQQIGRRRRIGLLIAGSEQDAEYLSRVAAFRERLSRLGWIEGLNVQIDVRFGISDSERMRAHAAELVELGPEVIVTTSTPAAKAVRELSQTIPIVFVTVNDPVATGLVSDLARPRGNVTGFANYDPSIGGKWLQLLKEVVPFVSRVALIFDPANTPETYFPAIEAGARLLDVQVIKIPIRLAADIEVGIDKFGSGLSDGLIVFPDNTAGTYRDVIIQRATQRRLPAVYGSEYFVSSGGLMTYTSDIFEQYRDGASYVDRILRGTNPGELPVQFPSKYRVIINLKAACTGERHCAGGAA